MAAASNVSFDILLGGKLTPEAIKALNDTEEKLKNLGASSRTINQVMSRAYKATFDTVTKEGEKAFNKVEHSSKEAFRKMAGHAKEAASKIKEDFSRVFELLKKPFEFIGGGVALGAVGGAFAGGFGVAEQVRRGIEIHVARQVSENILRQTLAIRGRPDLYRGYTEQAEAVAARSMVGLEFAMGKITKIAAKGGTPEAARQRLMDFIGIGGGTEEGATAAMTQFARATGTGKVNLRGLAQIGRGTGFTLLDQIAKDLGVAKTDLPKLFQGKTAMDAAAAMAVVNKALRELGEKTAPLIEARMKGWEGLLHRLGLAWDNFSNKLGEFWLNILTPIMDDLAKWLESINWETTFKDLIERSKEFGNTIRVVFAGVVNSPVPKKIAALFDNIWKAMTGGVQMYEKDPVRVWNSVAEARENATQAYLKAHTHLVRPMTPEFEKWNQETSDKIIGILNKLTEFINRLIELKKALDPLLTVLGKLIGVLNGIDEVIYGKLLPALWDLSGKGLQKVFEFVQQLGDIFKGLIDKIISWIPDWAKPQIAPSGVAQKRADLEREKANELGLLPSPDTPEKVRANEAKRAEIEERYNKQIKALGEATQATTDALRGKSPGFIPAVNDAVASLTAFIPAMKAATAQLGSLSLMGPGGMGGGGLGGPAGAHETEYGPGVAGDQPGQATYDWNSYHRVGAWPGVTGSLRPGDVALGKGSQAQYGVSPGQYFTTASGHYVRFADRSGSKDPYNIDYFKMARGGLVKGPTGALLGENGPEMVLPLTGNLMSRMGHTVNLSFGNISFGAGGETSHGEGFIREFAETIADQVRRVIAAENRRSAVV